MQIIKSRSLEYECNECQADYDILLLCQHAGSLGETQLVLLFLQQPPLYMQKKWSHSLILCLLMRN